MKRLIWGALFVLMLFGVAGPAVAASNEPMALLLEAGGKTEYSRDGAVWKPVTRNKFLFEGSRVKTGENSTCKVIDYVSNVVITLEPLSEVLVGMEGLQVVKGDVSEGGAVSDVVGGLKRKYAKVQKYTVVLRAAAKIGPIDFNTPRKIVLSEAYPDLVWESPGEEYGYRLMVADQVIPIAKTGSDIIRVALKGVEPGEYDYGVQVLLNGTPVHIPDMDDRLTILSNQEQQAVNEAVDVIQAIDPGNDFLLGNLFDEKGLKVPAMDAYRRYFDKHPEDNELRPFLIKIYKELSLEKLKKSEAEQYNRSVE